MIYLIILAASVGAICLGWGWRKGLEPAGLGTSVAGNMSSGVAIIVVGAGFILAAVLMGLYHWL